MTIHCDEWKTARTTLKILAGQEKLVIDYDDSDGTERVMDRISF